MTMLRLEKADISELDACYGLIEEGRAYQQSQGFTQWTEKYPDITAIKEDIEAGNGYVFKLDGDIAAYMCISFEKEPAYDFLSGSWHRDKNYAVFNRLSVSDRFRGQGISNKVFELSEHLCISRGINYVRTNTAPENKLMQHIFEKNGYSFCGELDFRGGKKIAYDKVITA